MGNATSASNCSGNAVTASNLVGTPSILVQSTTASNYYGSNATFSNLTVSSASGTVMQVKQDGNVNIGTSTVKAYPPAAMTGNTTNILSSYGTGNYVMSASSLNVSNVRQPWHAFDKNSDTFWQSVGASYSSTNYTRSTSTVDKSGNSYIGEWIQIQLPVNIVMSSYSISGYIPSNAFTPSTFSILGSTDGVNWTLVNQQIGNTLNIVSFNVNTTISYNYFRMVTNKIIGVSGDAVVVSEWILYGTQSSINITPDGKIGLGVSNPTQQLEVAGNVIVNGSISKSSGTFDIGHPLDCTKRLLHSFVEGPRCDLIYRGTTTLVNGVATVNIDKECVQNKASAMTEGTFLALCANPVKYLNNNKTFDRLLGTISGNILTITCENSSSDATVDWMVVAERKDAYIKQWCHTDADGYLITEY